MFGRKKKKYIRVNKEEEVISSSGPFDSKHSRPSSVLECLKVLARLYMPTNVKNKSVSLKTDSKVSYLKEYKGLAHQKELKVEELHTQVLKGEASSFNLKEGVSSLSLKDEDVELLKRENYMTNIKPPSSNEVELKHKPAVVFLAFISLYIWTYIFEWIWSPAVAPRNSSAIPVFNLLLSIISVPIVILLVGHFWSKTVTMKIRFLIRKLFGNWKRAVFGILLLIVVFGFISSFLTSFLNSF